MLHDVLRAVDELGRVERLGRCHAFAPPLGVGSLDPHQEDVSLMLDIKDVRKGATSRTDMRWSSPATSFTPSPFARARTSRCA